MFTSGKIIWFTGLSGSGKTTLATAPQKKFSAFGKTSEILDGDIVRNSIHGHLGFTREDIKENNRLLAKLALEKSKKHDYVLVSAISPFREDRAMAKNILGSRGHSELRKKQDQKPRARAPAPHCHKPRPFVPC